MHNFDYHRPSSLDDAVAALGKGEDASLVAGGMTLIPTMKQRLAAPSDLVDLGGIADLVGIKDDGDSVTIGAMTTHAAVAASSAVPPSLAALAGNIGDAQVRNRGTIGGSVANNDPTACYPSACLALGATIVTNAREIPADDFFTGMFETALEESEIIKAVRFPKPEAGNYQKFENPASRYALVGVFVAKTKDGVRVAVTGAGNDGVFRAGDIEQALSANFSPDAVDSSSIPVDSLNGDIHASAEYRQHLIGVMARRAVAAING
ncbi:xanthine dehydrogenase family protein subunit M [Marivibrio halodurans]|uniref:Xanthine dehydrogenase family protein subunit M n=1 Tax=Marivibrio halodurans TaxID=2039722 RepID=A0A8J7V0J4_9PROT|nr:xanthine dehydrogenase family protein subunit M [Marivibrio halodurans]MBP5855390.1 xanthine dehydrogenase family protein subunit M [Marivibrio halodurans]